jgi:hypothetical protein
MVKYRFKTEEEFKKDDRWKSGNPMAWSATGAMNQYLGKDIPGEYNEFCDQKKPLSYKGWAFTSSDYILKEEENYINRFIKAKRFNIFNTGVHKDEIIKINDSNEYHYILNTSKNVIPGMRISRPLDLEDWELLPEDYTEEILEYVECIRKLVYTKVGKIYKVISDTECESDDSSVTYFWKSVEFKPSTKEDYEAQFKEEDYEAQFKEEEKFKVGDYCVKENWIFIKVEEKPSYKCNNFALNIKAEEYFPGNCKMRTYNSSSERHATQEEKNWLDACIKAGKFVPNPKNSHKIPTYVKCIQNYGSAKVGDVFCTKDNSLARKYFALSWYDVLIKDKHLEKNTHFVPYDLSLKNKPDIEDVHSVSVKLRTKNKKFKF